MLGAGTAPMFFSINVVSLGEVQSRRQQNVQASATVSEQLTTAVATASTFAYAGRSDMVNQMSYRRVFHIAFNTFIFSPLAVNPSLKLSAEQPNPLFYLSQRWYRSRSMYQQGLAKWAGCNDAQTIFGQAGGRGSVCCSAHGL